MNIPPEKRIRQLKSELTSNVYHALLAMGGYGTDYVPMEISRDEQSIYTHSEYQTKGDRITLCHKFAHTEDGDTHERYYTTTITIDCRVDDRPPE